MTINEVTTFGFKLPDTKGELQRIVDEAYRQGKADGGYSYATPITVTPMWENTEITCKGGTS